jgi:hypothetical protein
MAICIPVSVPACCEDTSAGCITQAILSMTITPLPSVRAVAHARQSATHKAEVSLPLSIKHLVAM